MNRTPGGTPFRDLDHDGVMAPFEDPRLPTAARVADLVPRLSIEEKAGLLFHTMIGIGAAGDHDTPAGAGTPRQLAAERLISHFNLHELPDPAGTVRWQNAMQELAATTPHGIPITFSTDPRHAFAQNSGVAFAAGTISQWPEPVGLAAIGDPAVVRRYGEVVRAEYAALGIRAALHPQIDLATEARWGRQAQTFGQDAALTSRLVVEFLAGMGGDGIGADAVACTVKHFPGGGPQADGEDPHFPYGREQVYPGGRFAEHLEPFRAAIAAGTAAIMPYYGMPVGLALDGETVDPVGFGFNRRIIAGLLRETLGYDGVVLTDWGLITDAEIAGRSLPARAWGVEHLSRDERMLMILDAGCDQFGGEACTDLLLELVADGRVAPSRLDDSVRRLLTVKFDLGLFDDPFRDEDTAVVTVGAPEYREAGLHAQAESVTVLRNDPLGDRPTLPLAPATRVYLEGIDADAFEGVCEVVETPGDADLAIVRLAAPFEPRDHYFLEAMFHQGSLDFPDHVIEHLSALAAHVPLLVDVGLDRPAVLTPIEPIAAALTVTYGCSDAALVAAVSGRIPPRGRLPFELPRSMAAVAASRTDVASDTVDPLHPFGAGLTI